MQNPIVEYLQLHIGKEVEESPSAFSLWLKGTLLSAEEGHVSASFSIRDDMTNPIKNLHGGVSAAIMDDMMGLAVFTLNKQVFFTSVSLNVDFLAPASIGDTITAVAKVVRNGKTMVNVECHIYGKQGKLIAKGSSNLLVTGKMVE
ncbi:MAG: PaaI family thioesterase [Chitinophagales bacterium]|nr:PaaI family thioesterase [Chitinophagales bacterium]